jgi:hypothetical protein
MFRESTFDGRRDFSKLPPLGHSVKRGMALERSHIGRKQAEADRAAVCGLRIPAGGRAGLI